MQDFFHLQYEASVGIPPSCFVKHLGLGYAVSPWQRITLMTTGHWSICNRAQTVGKNVALLYYITLCYITLHSMYIYIYTCIHMYTCIVYIYTCICVCVSIYIYYNIYLLYIYIHVNRPTASKTNFSLGCHKRTCFFNVFFHQGIWLPGIAGK